MTMILEEPQVTTFAAQDFVSEVWTISKVS